MNQYGFIYKTTNLITGIIYIGQRMIRGGWGKNSDDNYLGSGVEFLKDLKLYGRENFKREILESCKNGIQLDKREIFWVAFYNARDINIGHNKSVGGQQPMRERSHTDQSKQRMSNTRKQKFIDKTLVVWNKGLKRSQEQIDRQILTRKRNNKPAWNKGIKKTQAQMKNHVGFQKGRVSPFKGMKNRYSEERIEQLRQAAKGNTKHLGKSHTQEAKDRIGRKNKGKCPPNAIQVVQINKKTNEFINIFESVGKAIIVTKSATIKRVAEGKHKTSGGYKWKYLKNLTDKEIKFKKLIYE